ncbi:MAG TPA: GTP 3',8-cyclase MoaA [Candidatus Eremiobacteraceae bacterium]|jgi:cyclic pyranopterin phosphate synthase
MTIPTSVAVDSQGRPLTDLRISVTDRCNFRCTYCMPKGVFGRDFKFLASAALLTFEEIERLARIFIAHGVEKIRLTGGEPLLRRGLDRLVARLAAIDGLTDLTLTTNGSLLDKQARALRDAGLRRITVSLDSLDDAVFRAMNDVDFPVARVLAGIEAASAAGFERIKINCVVKRGVNESSIVELARRFRGTGHVVRFIEYMDVGSTNGWRLDDVVPASEILELLEAEFGVRPIAPVKRSDVASRYEFADGSGEFGVIASVTQPFCRDCSRARLSSEGLLYTCLFATVGQDLRAPLREGKSDAEIASLLRGIWHVRADRYSELRTADTVKLPKVEMSHIGG